MSALVLDGRKVAQEIQEELRSRIQRLRSHSRPPALAVVLVGEDPASQIYVRKKIKTSGELGIESIDEIRDASITTDELLAIIHRFNQDPEIDGILVQTPLPKHVDTARILQAIDPGKDADGLHPLNVGRLVANRPAPRACTPAGIMEILRRYEIPVTGAKAVIVGRSDIVGKPMALMLLNESATVTICHSRTKNLAEECRRGDILIAAMGRPAALTADYLKPGCVIVDVGVNRITDSADVERLYGYDPKRISAFKKAGAVLVGDVDPFAMREISSAYTPVPGGVGPLTIAMLMANTVALAEQHVKSDSKC